jgi:predicted peptidase
MRYRALMLFALAGCAGGSSGGAGAPAAGSSYRLVPQPSVADSAAAAAELARIAALPIDLFEPGTFTAANGTAIAFRLLPPADRRPGVDYPLVVVFHGSGEIGTDNAKQMDRFPKAWARPEVRREYPSWVLAPQMPERSALYSGPVESADRTSRPAPPLLASLELIDSLIARLPIDRTRVYAIGFSVGASTTWNAVALRPGLVAAAIPSAGVPSAQRLVETARPPLWIIHGNADEANDIARDRGMYDALRSRAGSDVLFWEYDGGYHAVPPTLLAGMDFPRWLFAHRR